MTGFGFQLKDNRRKEQMLKLLTTKLLGGMSGMQDALINEKTDGSKEANCSPSSPAEGDRNRWSIWSGTELKLISAPVLLKNTTILRSGIWFFCREHRGEVII